MSNIQKRLSHLPEKPKELNRWILIGKAKLKAQIEAIKAIDKLEEGFAAKEAALCDTQDLAEELLYAESRLGGLLETNKPKPKSDGSSRGTFGGREESLPKGINKKKSHYAQTLHRHEDKIAEVVAKAREKGDVPLRQHVLNRVHTHVAHNTGESEWYTPQEYIDAARSVMGTIDCDPATTAKVNKRIKAVTFYTRKDSGLNKKWQGNVWLNPPYSQPLVRQFIEQFIEKYKAQEIHQGCVLINNVTETDFGQQLMDIASGVCFPQGRVKFLDVNGKPGAPLQGQMLVYCGPQQQRFVKAFGRFGVCLVPFEEK